MVCMNLKNTMLMESPTSQKGKTIEKEQITGFIELLMR